jgi:dihydropteroate synthase
MGVHHGLAMEQEGASIIDIGAESTRPGSKPVPQVVQIKRLIPVIEGLRKRTHIPISVDAYQYEVVKAAVEAGATMINDITAISDERVGRLAAQHKLPVVLMHMKGRPEFMQENPEYTDVVADVKEYLLERAAAAEKLGIEKDLIFIDPGIGFGKTFEHNLKLLKHLDEFVNTGYRVLLGTSRKGFLGKITSKTIPAERVMGTAATAALGAFSGVSIMRVHDVSAMADVVKVANSIRKSE